MPGKNLKTARQEWNSEDNKDVVIVHEFPRDDLCPSLSQYPMKLETFLRMHDINYKSDFEFPMHPVTKKCPWISLNGEEVADSQLCIEHITKHFKLTPKNDLSKPEDKVLSRGLRSLFEDNLYFCQLSDLYVHGKPDMNEAAEKFPSFVPVKVINNFIIKRVMAAIAGQAKAQGIGRHSKETIVKMAEEDLEAASLALGEKPFFLGNEPSEIDCCMFGFLSVMMFSHSQIKYAEIPKVLEKFDNLKKFTERMKEKFWSDWDECLKKKEEEKSAEKTEEKPEEKPEEETKEATEDKKEDSNKEEK